MKYGFFVIVLANLIFFFWEVQEGRFQTANHRSDREDDLGKQIWLLNELPESTTASEFLLAERSKRDRSSNEERPESLNLAASDDKPSNTAERSSDTERTTQSTIQGMKEEKPDEPRLGVSKTSADPFHTGTMEQGLLAGADEIQSADQTKEERVDNLLVAGKATETLRDKTSQAISVQEITPPTSSTKKEGNEKISASLNRSNESSVNLVESSGSDSVSVSADVNVDNVEKLADAPKEGNALNDRVSDEVLAKQPKNALSTCWEVGPFDSRRQIANWLNEWKLDRKFTKIYQKSHPVLSAFLVYYPAAETYAESKRNAIMLKEKGVTDMWLFREGEMKGVISLGLFRQKSRAVKLIKGLAEIGVEAEIAERYKDEQKLFVKVNQLLPDKDFAPLNVSACHTPASESGED